MGLGYSLPGKLGIGFWLPTGMRNRDVVFDETGFWTRRRDKCFWKLSGIVL